MKDINATIIVELTPPIEKIKENLHKDARWGIKKAQREGLTVRISSDDSDWKEIYKIYKETVKSGGLNPKPFEFLKENTHKLFVCEKNGKIIAGAGIWFSDKYDIKIPRLFFNASNKEYLPLQPNNLLYWECIRWCKNNGYNKFDLGGWQINAKGHLKGINSFKEKWGNIVYYEKEYSFFKAIGKKFVRKYRIFRWLNEKIKGRT